MGDLSYLLIGTLTINKLLCVTLHQLKIGFPLVPPHLAFIPFIIRMLTFPAIISADPLACTITLLEWADHLRSHQYDIESAIQNKKITPAQRPNP